MTGEQLLAPFAFALIEAEEGKIKPTKRGRLPQRGTDRHDGSPAAGEPQCQDLNRLPRQGTEVQL